MDYFFVDYENVKVHGLAGIDHLAAEDRIFIFYSVNADTLTFEMHQRLNASAAQISFYKVDVGGKNALDFQLSSFLGYIICKHADLPIDYYIVTRDQGFSNLVQFWKKKSIPLSLVNSVYVPLQRRQNAKRQQLAAAEQLAENAPQVESAPLAEVEQQIEAAQQVEAAPLAESAPQVEAAPQPAEQAAVQNHTLLDAVGTVIADQQLAAAIAKIIAQYKTKQGIHNALIKKYPSPQNSRASELYAVIKPLIAHKKGADRL